MHALCYILVASLSLLASSQTCLIDSAEAGLLSSSLASPSRTLTFDNLGYTDFTGWEGGGGTKILTLNSAGDTIKGTTNCVIFRGQWLATSWNGAVSWPSEIASPGYFVGIDSGFDTCTFTFSGSVLAIVARANSFSNEGQVGTMIALDDRNTRIGCTTIPESSGGTNTFEYVGIQTKSKAIKTITLTGGYSVFDNIQIVACQSGYSVQSGSCVDDDECAMFASDCHYMAECQNTPGSFTCTCTGGMIGTGHGDEGCVYPPVAEPVAVPMIAPTSAPVTSPVTVPMSVPVSPPLVEPFAAPPTIPTFPPVSEPIPDPVPSPTPEPVPSTMPIGMPIPIPPTDPTAQPQAVPFEAPVAVPSINVPAISQPSTVPFQPHSDETPASKGTQPNQACHAANSPIMYLLPIGIVLYSI